MSETQMPPILKILKAALVATTTLVAAPAFAGGPVVVELYTSQGCSSCPPADAFLSRDLSKRDDVIALALHVDYWDYIGWKDDFAKPGFTQRQRAYARAAGHRTVYTPQMIISGVDHVIGSHPNEVNARIKAHAASPTDVGIMLSRTGDTLKVELSPGDSAPEQMSVQLVRFLPSATRDIKRGENAGRKLTYSNIVTEWKSIGDWNMRRSKTMRTRVKSDEPVVVIVQRKGHGHIAAAARLN